MYKERERECEIRAKGERKHGMARMPDERGEEMEGELRWIANSSHINKREDTVCETAEKPPSLQPSASKRHSKLIKNT